MSRNFSLKESEVTPQALFHQRRQFLKALGLGAAGLTLPGMASTAEPCPYPTPSFPSPEEKTSLKTIRGYNNYYEFSTDKEAVRILAQAFETDPWKLTVSGEVEQPLSLDLDDLDRFCTEERIYRLRCVEGWSMVIPWLGFPLAELLKKAKPLSSAQYIRFIGAHRPSQMIGQRRPTLDWPYTEALRIDEAMHPLTLMATGLYGEPLPKQNGAPIRLVVPWKYGFKSIKAITGIEVVSEPPTTTWMQAVPSEYGFYGNVNPDVSHPRWSQAREVRIGELGKRPTLMFNGYAEQVAHLYKGMDLRKHY